MESALTLARAKMLGDVSEVEVSNQDASSTAVSDTSTQLSSDSTLTEATQTVSTDDLGRIVPNGNEVDGDEGFVFKPHSDHEGKLVILLPAELANQVASVLLEDENGNVVEHGSSSGHANGGREHFRFTKPGEDYPQNLTVRITENNQATHTYFIPDPAQRYD